VGISWGTGVSAAVNAISTLYHLQNDVVQMIGSVGTVDSVIDGPELARNLSSRLGGNYYYLHAPLFVSDRAMRDALLLQPTVAETLRRARAAQVAIVGIGTTAPGASSFLRARHLTEEQVAELREQGVVGETAGWHFDIHGNAAFDINDRVIALQLNELREIPNVIAVACGQAKTRAILGVLRGGYVSALATDSATAEAVLQIAGYS
jgi:DNA-binding transcriptional regulator LsrR (DeoR family)